MQPSDVPKHTLHQEVADALARGLLTPAEVAGLTAQELQALAALTHDALDVGDSERALMLARALVVLAPYQGTGWHLLYRAHLLGKNNASAASALRAVRLLTPAPAAAEPEGSGPESGLDTGPPPLPATPPPEATLVLHDGRPLPLTDTPAALHHDTVTAKLAARALGLMGSRTNTVLWARGTDVTHTAIVDRPRASDGPGADPQAQGLNDEAEHTSIVQRQALALTRRRMGWSLTDTWSTTDVYTKTPGRKR